MKNLNRGMMIKKYKEKYFCLRDKYNELIMAVERKFPNESRHTTALKYIRETEERSRSGKASNASLS